MGAFFILQQGVDVSFGSLGLVLVPEFDTLSTAGEDELVVVGEGNL